MDRMHCDIVKDLLPLYVDDVCSEKSREMLEKHLKECEDCRKYYESLIDKTPEVVADEGFSFFQESEFIQKIKKKITFDMVVAGFVVFLVCVIGSTIYAGYPHEPEYSFFRLIDKRLEVEDIWITDLYQLESGEIFFTVNSDKEFTWPYTDTAIYDEKKDIYYSKGTYTYSWWDDNIVGSGTLKKGSFIYSPIGKSVDGGSYEISEIRFEGKKDSSILVWEKGQKLKPAPEEIEKEVEEMRSYTEDLRGGYCIFTKSALETME